MKDSNEVVLVHGVVLSLKEFLMGPSLRVKFVELMFTLH